jgi:hypothetical protein
LTLGKWREWIGRYGWAELCGTLGSYVGFYIALWFSGSVIAGSYGAAVGENIGFYGCIGARDYRRRRAEGAHVSPVLFAGIGKQMVTEFGLAELLDSLVVRPGATFLAVTMFGQTAGVLIGKIGADAVFYALAIGFYERRKARDAAP